uniref:Uncharacterized protein n=1 Tax=Rhizophora mucronata TaxID=61149 RepID=A0A2P2NNP7_RHIMU
MLKREANHINNGISCTPHALKRLTSFLTPRNE